MSMLKKGKKLLAVSLATALAVAGLNSVIAFAEDYVAEVGEVHTGLLSPWAQQEDIPAISQAFKDAYDRMDAAGFDMGNPPVRGADGYVQDWDSLVMRQVFVGGDHAGTAFGWEAEGIYNSPFGYLMMSDANGKAFPLVNEYLTYWANNSHWTGVGYPVSDIFTVGSDEYQVFSKSVLKSNGTTITEASGYYPGYAGGEYPTTGPWAAEGVKEATQQKFLNAYKNQQYAGFNLGKPHTEYGIKTWDGVVDGVMYQVFWYGDNPVCAPWNMNTGFIMQAAPDKNAYALKGDMLNVWFSGVGNHFAGAGAPDGDEFEMNGKVYQQFVNGYISFTKGDPSTAVYTEGKAPTPVPETVGVANDALTGKYEGKEAEVKQAFVDEYSRLNETGFYPGEPTNGGVIEMSDGSNQWLGQWLINGDSSANVLSYHAATLLMMNDLPSDTQTVFSVRNSILEKFISEGSVIDVGAPTCNEFTVENTVYQNFKYGYMSYTADDTANVVFVAGKQVSETGEITDLPKPEEPEDPKDPEKNPSDSQPDNSDSSNISKPDDSSKPNTDVPALGVTGIGTSVIILLIGAGMALMLVRKGNKKWAEK